MNVYALLAFYDEKPEHLTRCVESLTGFADYLIAVDGAYAHFPDAKASSPPPQRQAIYQAARRAGIKAALFFRQHPWQGGEVEKRAAMFRFARRTGATPKDWFLIIDADMRVARVSECARDLLEQAHQNVAQVFWQDIGQNGAATNGHSFRSLFRALPGLTVKHTHWLYVAPDERGEDRYLWHVPHGGLSTEPALNLIQHVTLHHRRLDRDRERLMRAEEYYRQRDRHSLERPPN